MMRAIAKARAVCQRFRFVFVMRGDCCTFSANPSARSCGRGEGLRSAAVARGAGLACWLLLQLGTAPATARADQDDVANQCDGQEGPDPLLAGAASRIGQVVGPLILDGGLSPASEARLWTLLAAGPPAVRPGEPIGAATAVALLLRLQRSRLFAELDLQPDPAGGALRLRLVEHPQVASAAVRGLRESPPADLLAHFLGSPSVLESDEGRRRPTRCSSRCGASAWTTARP